MKILVNGASISRGENTWPYYLQKQLDCELVNLALAGCGNTYIYESTVAELSRRSYDLVLIMWAEFGRIDLRVDKIEQFADSKNTSVYQSQQNDWPSKIIYPVNDQDYVQKNWIFSLGHLQGQRDSVSTVVAPLHRLQSHSQLLEADITKIIGLQAVIKNLQVPYLFMHWKSLKKFNRFDQLYAMVNWDNFYTNTCLELIAKENNWLAADGIHPGAEAHKFYANLIAQRIKNSHFG